MSTLGIFLIGVIALITVGVLWVAVADQGDDTTTPWDAAELEWRNATAAQVVKAASSWPKPLTPLLHHQVPLDTPVDFIAWAADDVPAWYHEQRGTTPQPPARHDGSQTRVWAGYTPARRMALTEDTGAWSVAEITGELVGAR